MTDEELLAWLRERGPRMIKVDAGMVALAADRIEALVKERDRFEAALGRACLVGGTTYLVEKTQKAEARAERLEAALRLLHENVVLAFPALADLGPVAKARAALKGADHE